MHNLLFIMQSDSGMNLRHERITTLCDTLNLPFVAQGYGAAAQDAAKREMVYSDFLEGLLSEACGRKVGKQSMMTRLADFPASRRWTIQTCYCSRFESLLKLRLNQRTIFQCDVIVLFCHATFFHKKCCT